MGRHSLPDDEATDGRQVPSARAPPHGRHRHDARTRRGGGDGRRGAERPAVLRRRPARTRPYTWTSSPPPTSPPPCARSPTAPARSRSPPTASAWTSGSPPARTTRSRRSSPTGRAKPDYEVWLPDSGVWAERAKALGGRSAPDAGRQCRRLPRRPGHGPSAGSDARLARRRRTPGHSWRRPPPRRTACASAPPTPPAARPGCWRSPASPSPWRRRRPGRRHQGRGHRQTAVAAGLRRRTPGRGAPWRRTTPARRRRSAAQPGRVPLRAGRLRVQLRTPTARADLELFYPEGRHAAAGLSVQPGRRERAEHRRGPGRHALPGAAGRAGVPADPGGARLPRRPTTRSRRRLVRTAGGRDPQPYADQAAAGAAVAGRPPGDAGHVDHHRAERPADHGRRYLGLDAAAGAGP